MVEKNIQNILEYWKKNPDVDVNAEEAVRIFVDASKTLAKYDRPELAELKDQLINLVNRYEEEFIKRLTSKDLGINENSALYQMLIYLGENARTARVSIDSETKDYLRTLASASLDLRQKDRKRRSGDTSIQRIHANDTELSFLTELREKVSKKDIEAELQKITELLYSEVRIANRHNRLINMDMSMSYNFLGDTQFSDGQEYVKTRELLRDRVNNLNSYLAEHQDVDINANEITEILLDSAKVIQQDPTHESEVTVEIINGVIELSQTAVNRLLSTDLQLEKNSTLCQLILQLTGNAVLGIPAVEEKEEEYIKNLAKISLFTRQEDRWNRIHLDNNHKIYDNENEYQTIKEQREIYKQNNQKGTYATITDCLFAEITKAKTENKIYSFNLPFPDPELKKVEVKKTDDVVDEEELEQEQNNQKLNKEEVKKLKRQLKAEISFLKEHPEQNIDVKVTAGLLIDIAKAKKTDIRLNVDLTSMWTKVFSNLSNNDLEETILADTLTYLYKSARSKKPAVISSQEKEYLTDLLEVNLKIQEQAKKRGEGQSLHLYDNEKEFNDLEKTHQKVKFNQPMTQDLADRLFKEIENAYTKASHEKESDVEPEEKGEQPKVEESKTIEQEKVDSLTKRYNGVKDFLKKNPEADINAVELADLFIEAAKIKEEEASTELKDAIEDLWLVAYPRLEEKEMEETVVAKTLINLAKGAIHQQAIVAPEEENFLKEAVRINFYIHQQIKRRENGETLRLFDSESEYNQIIAQSQNIHFSNPEIETQVGQLVNEIKSAYRHDQLIIFNDNTFSNHPTPKTPVDINPQPQDLLINELAIQIYNQRKMMQEIAKECSSLEEYMERIGVEVDIQTSNDEIEAEIVKIKK